MPEPREIPADLLIVEDNAADAELAVRAIRRRVASAIVHVVEDGERALDFVYGRGGYSGRVKNFLPKAVLLDLKLPGLSGLEVLRAIRSGHETRSVPVVIVSSSADDGDIRAAYLLGANSYVVKPVDFGDYLSAISLVGEYWLQVNQAPA